jgi:hypothetical protein
MLDNDTFDVDNISDPPLCVVFTPLLTPNFNYLLIILVTGVDPIKDDGEDL